MSSVFVFIGEPEKKNQVSTRALQTHLHWGACRKSSKAASSENPPSAKRAASSTPFGLTSGQPQGGTTVPPGNDANGGEPVSYGRVVHTEEGLSSKTQAELKSICQKRGLPVSGKKQVLIDRILTGQLGAGSSQEAT